MLKEEKSHLSDGEGWEIPSALDLLQIPSTEEEKESFGTVTKRSSENTQSTPANGFFVDETWGLSVSHEEEIVSSHINQEILDLEVTEKKDSDNMNTLVNAYELGAQSEIKCIDFGNCESVGINNHPEIETDTVKETNVRKGSIESSIGPDFNLKSVGNGIFSIDRSRQQDDTNLNLKTLQAGSSCHTDTSTIDEHRSVETPRVGIVVNKEANNITKSRVISPLKTNINLVLQNMESKESFPEKDAGKFAFPGLNGNEKFYVKNVTGARMWRTDVSVKMGEQPKVVNCGQSETVLPVEIFANDLPGMSSEPHLLVSTVKEDTNSEDGHVWKEQFVVEENATKRNLKLNLATTLGTDEIISTPVVLEPLLKQDEPFDLLAYVCDDVSSLTNVVCSVIFAVTVFKLSV